MNMNFREIVSSGRDYNFHAHTQFCDGRDSMADLARSALASGFHHFGFTPHSPLNISSPCNMDSSAVASYMKECDILKDKYQKEMKVYTSMEIDWLGRDWGPHIDYFQNMGLDYMLGSVHFVPNQDGVPIDCDGSQERFARYLKEGFRGDLRYVVERYFEQVILMIEAGGFDLLGHFDKIAGNAAGIDDRIETTGWYEALVDDVVSHSVSAGLAVEINTKALETRHRFYPHEMWWDKLLKADLPLVIDSDAHYASKVTSGRKEAFELLDKKFCCLRP